MCNINEKIYEIISSGAKNIIEKTVMFNFEKKLLEIINTPNKYNYDDLEYLTFCSKIFNKVIHETEYYKNNNNILDLTFNTNKNYTNLTDECFKKYVVNENYLTLNDIIFNCMLNGYYICLVDLRFVLDAVRSFDKSYKCSNEISYKFMYIFDIQYEKIYNTHEFKYNIINKYHIIDNSNYNNLNIYFIRNYIDKMFKIYFNSFPNYLKFYCNQTIQDLEYTNRYNSTIHKTIDIDTNKSFIDIIGMGFDKKFIGDINSIEITKNMIKLESIKDI